MNIKVLLLSINFLAIPYLFSQNTDSKPDIIQLKNNNDWFEFKEIYENERDNYSEFFNLTTECYLYTFFNKPYLAIEKLEVIAQDHVEDLGLDIIPYLDLLAKNYAQIRRFDKTQEIYLYLSKNLDGIIPQDKIFVLKEKVQYYSSLINVPKQEFVLSSTDSQVKIDTTKGLIFLDVSCNKVTTKAIFDTGSNMNYVSLSMAKKIGIKPLVDSIEANDKTILGEIGILDSLYIGHNLIKNALFYVGEDKKMLGGVNIDLIIGTETINLMKCIQFDFNKMIMDIDTSVLEKNIVSNMILKDNFLYINASIDNKNAILLYDSGYSGDFVLSKKDTTFKYLFSNSDIYEHNFLTVGDTVIKSYKCNNNVHFEINNSSFITPVYYGDIVLFADKIGVGTIGKTIIEKHKGLKIDFVNMEITTF